jgi:hypothetical protein
MTKASSRSIAITALTAIALAVGTMPARAQTGELKASIPFSFYAGGQDFPAGEYTVRRGPFSNAMIQLSDLAGHTLNVLAIPAVREPEHGAKLIFNKYGDEYFLSEVRWTWSSAALQFPQSPRERELAKTITPQQIASRDKRP